MRLREAKWFSCCLTQLVSSGVRIERRLSSSRAQRAAAYLCCLPSSVVSLLKAESKPAFSWSCKQLDHINYSVPSNYYSRLFADSYLQICLLPKIYFNPKSILEVLHLSHYWTCASGEGKKFELLEVDVLSYNRTRWSSAVLFQLSYCNQESFSQYI